MTVREQNRIDTVYQESRFDERPAARLPRVDQHRPVGNGKHQTGVATARHRKSAGRTENENLCHWKRDTIRLIPFLQLLARKTRQREEGEASFEPGGIYARPALHVVTRHPKGCAPARSGRERFNNLDVLPSRPVGAEVGLQSPKRRLETRTPGGVGRGSTELAEVLALPEARPTGRFLAISFGQQ